MEKIKSIIIVTFVAIATLVNLSSCDKSSNTDITGEEGGDTPIVTPAEPTIIGEWFCNMSTSEKTYYGTYSFKENGEYSLESVYACISERLNYIDNITSTYTLNGDILSLKINDASGSSYTSDVKITYLDSYTMIQKSEYSEEKYSRIVGSINVNLGGSTNVVINDNNFIPISFESSDTRVVSVDKTGKLTAIKRGKAFVTANSKEGSVTYRVTVVDGNNLIDNFADDLTLSRKQVEEKYGNNYFENSTQTDITYYPGDGEINSLIYFLDIRKNVNMIGVQYWSVESIENAKKTFDRTYNLQYSDNGISIYKDGDVTIKIDEATLQVVYLRRNSVTELIDDGIYLNIDDFIASLGLELTDELREEGFVIININNVYYDKMSVLFDPITGFIKLIKVTCLEGVKQSDIEPWYQQYYYYLDEMGYCIQEDWWNMNPRVFVKFLEEDGRTVISYIATLKQ